MRIAILDPAAGISGDMTLGALLALGVPQNWLEALPGRLGFEGVAVTVRNAMRCGVGGKQVEFTIPERAHGRDRKSTRLNSSHGYISYAVFCLEKKKKTTSTVPC